MANFQYDFFMSRIEHIRDIKENDKIKISLVLYEGVQGPCIFKICKNRDVSDVYKKLSDIRHPNIAVIHDYLYVENNTYIIEEYIDGSTINKLLEQNGCFSEKETVQIVLEVCKGLEILHKKNPPIIHNDINTSNIMIREDGSVKIFDFDISRTYKAEANKNTRLFGTEEYAAPEHYGYGQSEPRTDIYSLGVTMHEMLTGRKLDNQHNVTYKGKLKKIIKKCIQIDPKNRYFSISQLKRALRKNYSVKSKLFCAVFIFIILFFIMDIFGMESTQTEEKRQSIDVITSQQLENTTTEQGNQEIVKPSSEQISFFDVESESAIISLKMSTIAEISGLFESMVALNDGTIVYLERSDYYYYIKDSIGQENLLNNLSLRYCKLGYDGYKDVLYLFEIYEDSVQIYSIDKELEKEELAQILYTSNGNYDSEEIQDVRFYSDGIVDIAPHIPLIDTNTWMVVGESEEYDAIINDCNYNIYLNPKDERYRFIHEIDFSGNIIQEYRIPEYIQTQALEEICGYQNRDIFYFIGLNEGKYGVYGFDGNKLSNIIYLNDYRYYSEILIEDWCVSKEKIWIYDALTHTIKEFPLK